MCIRDRAYVLSQLPSAVPFAISTNGGADFAVSATEAVLEAVSYTHLRAHETVLDLVCRLLLDKKNTNKSIRPHR